jgi:hypothetical protein
MIENFMSYTYDRCTNMFTQGQAAVMQTALNTLRSGLLTSDGLQPHDIANAGIDIIRYPVNGVCSSTIAPEIRLTNYGAHTLTSAEIRYAIDNGSTQAFHWSGSLATFASETVELDEIALSPGARTITAYIVSANSAPDGFSENDTVVKTFTVASASAAGLPFSEGFNGNYFPPIGWESENPDASVGWSTGSSYTIGSDGQNTKAAYVNYHIYEVMGEQDALVTPLIDLSGATQPELTFDFAFAEKPDVSLLRYGKFEVLVATDCKNFIPVMSISGDDLATISSPQSSNWGPNSAGVWSLKTVDLSAFAGQQIKIMFRAQNGRGNNMFMDNVEVAEKASVGTGDYVAESHLRVYPNPSSDGMFYIDSEPEFAGAVIEVYNSLGALVLQKNCDLSQRQSIDLKGKAAGHYLVRIIGEKEAMTLPVVVQR